MKRYNLCMNLIIQTKRFKIFSNAKCIYFTNYFITPINFNYRNEPNNYNCGSTIYNY